MDIRIEGNREWHVDDALCERMNEEMAVCARCARTLSACDRCVIKALLDGAVLRVVGHRKPRTQFSG